MRLNTDLVFLFFSVPEWAKNQIADDPNEGGQGSRQDDNNRRGGSGRGGRRGRGRGRGGDDDDGGEETRPSKDVTLFDFFGATPKPQKTEPKPTQNKPTSNKSGVSSAVQVIQILSLYSIYLNFSVFVETNIWI